MILLGLALASLQPPPDCSDAETQAAMNQCAGREFAAAEAEYAALWASLSESQRIQSADAARDWEAYRESQCRAEADVFAGGSILPLVFANCKTRMTKARIAEVKAQYAIEQAVPLSVGETHRRVALDEEREINVVLPVGYEEEPGKRYPVVYLLDGGNSQDLMMGVGIVRWNAMWGRSEHAIIVGVETKDRQRELLPPTKDEQEQERYPTAGESAAFHRYLAQTVKPMVEANYRTDGRAFLVGESAAGHFVIETWATRWDMFDGYAAISPSLQWNGQQLSKLATAPVSREAPLYLSLADEGGAFEEGVMRVADRLSEGDQPYCFSDRRKDLSHGTSLHGLLPEALQYLLPTKADWLDDYGMHLRCDGGGPALP